MPQKTTYFFPKLTSGLLLYPLDYLAPEVCRAATGRRSGSARRAADTGNARAGRRRRARAATRRRQSTRAAERVVVARFAGLDTRIVSGGDRGGRRRPLAGRDRPDRRLAERKARHPVLLCLDRGCGRRRDARRVLRIRARLRLGEEWTAHRGDGAYLDGRSLVGQQPKDEIEILSFEATRASEVSDKAAAFTGVAYRFRIMGSLALSLCTSPPAAWTAFAR